MVKFGMVATFFSALDSFRHTRGMPPSSRRRLASDVVFLYEQLILDGAETIPGAAAHADCIDAVTECAAGALRDVSRASMDSTMACLLVDYATTILEHCDARQTLSEVVVFDEAANS